jgi:hypothetical protein
VPIDEAVNQRPAIQQPYRVLTGDLCRAFAKDIIDFSHHFEAGGDLFA